MLALQDKRLFHSYLNTVEGAIERIEDEIGVTKDKTLAQRLREVSTDLAHVTADMHDTVNRV